MADEKFTFVIPEYLRLKIMAKAKSESKSKSEIVRQALESYFKKQDDEVILDKWS